MENAKLIKDEPYRKVWYGIMNKQEIIYQEFYRTAVEANNLQDSILFNQYVFTNTALKAFPDSFLPLEYDQTQQAYIFYQPYYKQNLHEYIKGSKNISETQALQIFSKILKSVYSLFIDNLVHKNIRPEHFALENGQWKLRAAVFTNQNYGISNQFTISEKYQAPEQYQKDEQEDPDLCPIIVWNLGSILLDLVMGSHILNSQKVLKKFKNQEFSFKSIGIKKKISFDLEAKLGKMLHFKPEERMKISQIFENSYFSKQVAKHYKDNKERTVEAMKEVAKGPGLKSSMKSSLRGSIIKSNLNGSKLIPKPPNMLNNSNRGTLNVPYNEVNKSNLRMLDIDANASRQNLMMSRKNNGLGILSMAIQQEDEFFMELAEKTKIIPKATRIEDTLDPSVHTIDNTAWLKNIFSIYKTFIDRSSLLCVSVEKFSQIPYEDKYRNEFILLNEFSVYYVSLIELNKIIQSINKNHNIYKVNGDKFDEFLRSTNFQAFKEEMNSFFRNKKEIFERKAALLMNLSQNQRNLMRHERFINYVQNRNIYEHTFAQIKKPYRQILKMTYDKLSVLFNSTKQQQLCRLSLYTVYCMTIDKLYIQEDMEDNFKHFVEWNSLNSTLNFQVDNQKKHFLICVSQLQRYFDTAPIKLLIEHSKKILRKYYKI